MQITVNEPGARTIADSRPMLVEGQNVYVTVGAGTASLFIGGRIVATQDAETMSNRGAQDWAVAYLAEQTQADELHAADWFAAQSAAFAEEVTATDEREAVGAVQPLALLEGEELATVVEALGADFEAREQYTHRLITVTATELARRIREALRFDLVAAEKNGTDSRYIEISNGEGSSYGHYFPAGSWAAFSRARGW